MIPTFIYEEAQGNAFIRSIDEYERENEKRLPIFQEIINKLFEATNATFRRKKIIMITKMRIFSTLIQEAYLRKNNKIKASHWGEQIKNYRIILQSINNENPRIPDNKELAELSLEAYKANKAIEELRKITIVDGGENLMNYFHMTYRKQLRASHLKKID